MSRMDPVCVCGGGGVQGPGPAPLKTLSESCSVRWTPLPPPPTTIPRFAHTCTILHIMYMYIYHFLVRWNGREFDYWHTNRVGSVLSAAHTFYITPTSQRACALAFMSPFSTVAVFYVTPAEETVRQTRQKKWSGRPAKTGSN